MVRGRGGPAIRVRFQGGVFIPEEPVDVPEGQAGLVTIEAPSHQQGENAEQAWCELLSLVERCKVQTGIADLAQHHDHYLYASAT